MSTSKKQYGVAVIACGARGKAHSGAWSRLDNVAITAVTDPDEERANELAQQHNAEIASDYREAIDRDDVDIVSVCTPACLHADPTVFAAEAGKRITLEKGPDTSGKASGR